MDIKTALRALVAADVQLHATGNELYSDAERGVMIAAANKIEHQATFIEFVLLWLTRDRITNVERVSVIKNHPYLQDIIKERAAVHIQQRAEK